MDNDRRRLRRARLIERIRCVEHRSATSAAQTAALEYGQVHQLAQRTRELATQYGGHQAAGTVVELRAMTLLDNHLAELGRVASGHADAARRIAEDRQTALLASRRRFQCAEDQRRDICREYVDRAERAEAAEPRRVGTVLE